MSCDNQLDIVYLESLKNVNNDVMYQCLQNTKMRHSYMTLSSHIISNERTSCDSNAIRRRVIYGQSFSPFNCYYLM